jgi:hypothetical protein
MDEPSRPGGVLLDVGGDVGALIVYADAALAGREIDILPVDPGTVGTHAIVRRRELPSGAQYAAVYPRLPSGRYRLASPGAPDVVFIPGGRVTHVHLGR